MKKPVCVVTADDARVTVSMPIDMPPEFYAAVAGAVLRYVELKGVSREAVLQVADVKTEVSESSYERIPVIYRGGGD